MEQSNHYGLIKQAYENSKGDSTQLFQILLAAADEIGMEQAMAYLENCVTHKRLAWLQHNANRVERTNDPVFDAYHLFYEVYLGISAPDDGKIIEHSPQKIVTRWWNPCPTLEICQKLGLDTRQICQKIYHRPVQAFLETIDPRLVFERNYEALRPHQTYCEEVIKIERPG